MADLDETPDIDEAAIKQEGRRVAKRMMGFSFLLLLFYIFVSGMVFLYDPYPRTIWTTIAIAIGWVMIPLAQSYWSIRDGRRLRQLAGVDGFKELQSNRFRHVTYWVWIASTNGVFALSLIDDIPKIWLWALVAIWVSSGIATTWWEFRPILTGNDEYRRERLYRAGFYIFLFLFPPLLFCMMLQILGLIENFPLYYLFPFFFAGFFFDLWLEKRRTRHANAAAPE